MVSFENKHTSDIMRTALVMSLECICTYMHGVTINEKRDREFEGECGGSMRGRRKTKSIKEII